MSFTAHILKQGVLYFAYVLVMGTLQSISAYVADTEVPLFLTLAAAPVPILVSRFYFDLDELQNEEPAWTLPSAAPSLQFATSDHSMASH
ncbi:hypothetical protein BV20DRAFT_975666 [Pilatotrama ljubarskyi]|nr:hypothetical protein BV20DRAFT_975666 [Pilatotrama ljubarskyi]